MFRLLFIHFFPLIANLIGGVIVSMLAAGVREFQPWSGQTKGYTIGICCLSANYTALSSKSKNWFARNQDNVSEWDDMSSCGLLLSILICRGVRDVHIYKRQVVLECLLPQST